MEIKQIENTRDEAYLQLVSECGTLFHQPEWLALGGASLKLYGIYTPGGLTGAFFAEESTRLGIRLTRVPSFTPHCGLIFRTQASNASKALSEEKKMASVVAQFADRHAFGITSLSFPPTFRDMQPFAWRSFKTVVQYTYQFDLTPSGWSPENNMSPEHRNLVRKALKDGLVCKQVNDYSIIESLVLKSFDRKQATISRTKLSDILHRFARPVNSYAFVTYKGDIPVSTAFCVYDGRAAYYLLGGYDPSHKHAGAGILCLQQCIDHAKESGLQLFDFEGSMLPEVEKFFRGFGAALVPYYVANKAWWPLEVLLKWRKRSWF